ncbi:hypothetical protein ACYZTX_29245 [Pseudomonas sp. MDT1-17]
MSEQIRGLRNSVAAVGQQLIAPKTWIGSQDVNVLQVLCEVIEVIEVLEQMNTQLAAHKHGPSPVADNARSLPATPPRRCCWESCSRSRRKKKPVTWDEDPDDGLKP